MVRCFLVVKTGNSRSVEHTCGCGSDACSGAYTTTEYEWKRLDTGETKWGWPHDFGPGAMYLAANHHENGRGYWWDNDADTHLIVQTPGGSWDVDSRASNCTMKEDRQHRCWIRHGEPPNVTVDKAGNTCGAGAGSIMCGNYHGFLQNGSLT